MQQRQQLCAQSTVFSLCLHCVVSTNAPTNVSCKPLCFKDVKNYTWLPRVPTKLTKYGKKRRIQTALENQLVP